MFRVQILSYLNVELDMMFLVEAFIEMILVKEECEVQTESVISTDSVFPFPDKLTLERVSSGGLNRQESMHSPLTPTTANLASGLPSLTNVNDSLSATILVMDILIKQVSEPRVCYVANLFRFSVVISCGFAKFSNAFKFPQFRKNTESLTKNTRSYVVYVKWFL